MALCPLDQLKELVRLGAWDYASEHCRLKVREYDLSDDDVIRIILALQPTPISAGGNFRKEWANARTGDFGVLPADDYLISYDEQEHRLCGPQEGLVFYVKLGLYSDAQDSLCVVVRLHPS
jgi:hypothetical protein